jgi:hypothetical protein
MGSRKQIFFSTVLLFLFFGCDEVRTTTVSVSDEFTQAGNGMMVATVNEAGDNIQLNGELDLVDGVFSICLEAPSGDTIYTKVFDETGLYEVNESFERELGDWIFYYKISKKDGVLPSGYFDFDLIFKD